MLNTSMDDSRKDQKGSQRRITDARGRRVTQLDPVKLHLLNLPSIIPAATLRAMSDEIQPDARRQRLGQILSVAFSFLLIGGGTFVYFRYFSTWTGFDPVNSSIYLLQILIVLAGPVIAYYVFRARYASKIAAVMLKHGHCPHCGYALKGLSASEEDGATVCPECGCAWGLTGGKH